MGELAASLAHEVNNPIGAMVANASTGQRLIAEGNVDTEELNDYSPTSWLTAAGPVRLFKASAIWFAKAGRISPYSRSMIRLRIYSGLSAPRLWEERRTVAVEVDLDGGQVLADRVQLLQVLLNLTLNAFEAMSAMRADARRLVIRAGRNGNGGILVSVRDTGPGFPQGMVEQLFEPFFSTKAEGTGMGLAIARSIVEAHGGTLSGENCDDGGACFTVRLPEAKERQINGGLVFFLTHLRARRPANGS